MAVGRSYRFGPFRLETGVRVLLREERRLAVSPKAIELLIVLVEAQTNPVSKKELLDRVWADTAVEEGNLTTHISVLRKAIGDHYII